LDDFFDEKFSLSLPAILYKLKLNQSVTTIPTVGFNVETVSYKNIKFNVWVCGPLFAWLPISIPRQQLASPILLFFC